MWSGRYKKNPALKYETPYKGPYEITPKWNSDTIILPIGTIM